jgi:hypothetical protein
VNEEQAARLRSALEYVTEHPREWVQDHYLARTPCGTMACLAGRIVLRAGYRVVDWSPVFRYVEDEDDVVSVPDTEQGYSVMRDGDGEDVVKVSKAAAELIGLEQWSQADNLFAASNSLRTLWELAETYSDGLIEVPEDLPEWADLSVFDVDLPNGVLTSHVGAYLDQVERRVR